MNEITEIDSMEIADPALRRLAVRVCRQLEMAVEKVAAHHAHPDRYPMPADAHSFERILLNRFNVLSQRKRDMAGVRAMERINASPAIRARRYGDLAAIDLGKPVAVEAQAEALRFPADLKFPASHLTDLGDPYGQLLDLHLMPAITLAMQSVDPAAPTAPAAGAPVPLSLKKDNSPKSTKLALRIHKVKCVDETNGFLGTEAGDDEILLGGTTVDAVGKVTKVKEFTVRDDFDDGEQQVYSPPKVFTSFDLTKGEAFPKYYFVTLVMAEQDNGGFPEFLNDLVEALKGAVSKAIGGAIGSAIGGAFGGPIGAAIGALVGALLGWLIGLLKEIWEDDLFPPKTVSIKIPGFNCSWSGQKDGPQHLVKYEALGGEYHLTFDWQLLP
ncbi:MAG: hypothetical protein HGA75_11020 [Thiobacillus sp.]|nr:hypothetical protein [Thiobacillus sp.]